LCHIPYIQHYNLYIYNLTNICQSQHPHHLTSQHQPPHTHNGFAHHHHVGIALASYFIVPPCLHYDIHGHLCRKAFANVDRIKWFRNRPQR
ncbi:hypothetical protein BC829DRAFT_403377, partial [Chytridium lagenaria]